MTKTRPQLPGSYESLLNQAQAAYRAADIETAITRYQYLIEKLGRLSERVIARRPELHDMHQRARLELTGILHRAGRYAEAIQVEQPLLDTHPEQTDTWRTDLAVLRLAKGEVEAGLAELEALAEEHADDAGRWLILARETHIEGRLAKAQNALDLAMATAAESDPALQAQVYYEQFLLHKSNNQLDDAAAAWEQAVAHDPQASRSVRVVYTMFTTAGRYKDALRYVGRDENAVQAGFQRGLIASLTGDPAMARQEWQQVSKTNPVPLEYGHDAWVEAVLRLGKPDRALEWLQGALPRYASPRLFILSGIGWAMRDDTELAGILFQQAIGMRQTERPPKQKLDSADWQLLDSLVAKDEIKAPLKPYFAVVETLWG